MRSTIQALEGINIHRFSWNCLVNVVAAKPLDALIFGTILQEKGRPPLADQVSMNNNCIFGFGNEPEANLITSTEGLEIVLVIIKKSLFCDFANQMRRYDLDDTFMAKNVVLVEPTKLTPYQSYLQQIIYLCEQEPQLLQNSVMPTLIRNDLLPLFINTLQCVTKKNTLLPLRRTRIVKEAQEFMKANLHRPITLKDIYQAIYVSRRSLIYGFQDIFGIGPMSYLKIQRLNGVRRALLLANPQFNKVQDIASDWGFWHGGHFSHNYKEMFGETPLKTLKNPIRIKTGLPQN